MKRHPQPELHFDEKELNTNLGNGTIIFVGSSCDMWADVITLENIQQILTYCGYNYPYNTYLFQTKNPKRFNAFLSFPIQSIFGITLETNRSTKYISSAPEPRDRKISFENKYPFPKMLSIEPILDFDLEIMLRWVREIAPIFVSIGADSGNNDLPEPPADKILALIRGLRQFTEVKIKNNLGRLMPNLRQEFPERGEK